VGPPFGLTGSTLTSKVGFEDCIRTIKENAFVVSDYPVIVTIENHLSQANQKQAAKASFISAVG
jgi:hypothetical protein